MKTKKALFFILAAILGGCIPSLHPLFTKKDVFFEPQLVGTWAGEDAKDNWQFRPSITSEKLYEVVYTDDDGVEQEVDLQLADYDWSPLFGIGVKSSGFLVEIRFAKGLKKQVENQDVDTDLDDPANPEIELDGGKVTHTSFLIGFAF